MIKQDFYSMHLKPGDVITVLTPRANYTGSFLTLEDMPGNKAPGVVVCYGDILISVPLALINSVHILDRQAL